MRTRIRYDAIEYSGNISISSTDDTWQPGWTNHSPSTITLLSFATNNGVEQIDDYPAPRGIRSKTVTHTYSKGRINDISRVEGYTFNPSTGTPTGHRFIYSGAYSNVKWYGTPAIPNWSHLSTSYAKTDQQLISAAVHSFYNSNEVDNFTNIRESGQTVDLVKTVMDKLNKFGVVIIGKRKFPFKGGKFKKYLLGGSNAYLAYSFGVSPLVHDMKSIAKATKSLKDRLDKAIEVSRRRVTVHERDLGSISVNYSALAGFGADGSDATKYWYGKLIPLTRPTRICSVTGKRAVQFNTNLFNRLDYLANRFLSAGPASALWEAIPYSFVLDWFVDSSGIIDSLDNALTGSNKKIDDVCLSTKYDILWATYVTQRTGEYLTMANQNFSNQWFRYYHREPVTPGLTPVGSGRFGKKQASYLAALLHQMVANLR